jgi:acyl carrier protein
MPDIREKIKTFISGYFQIEVDSVLSDDASFIEEGIIDSVGVLELVAFIENTFGFRVEDEEIIPENLDSVNRLVVFVQLKLKERNS